MLPEIAEETKKRRIFNLFGNKTPYFWLQLYAAFIFVYFVYC